MATERILYERGKNSFVISKELDEDSECEVTVIVDTDEWSAYLNLDNLKSLRQHITEIIENHEQGQ